MSVDLSTLTTLGVGGPALRMIQPTTELDVVKTAVEVWRQADDWVVLGGGSNVVIGDDGIDGTVIRMQTRGVKRIDGDRADRVRVRVAAGEPWDSFVSLAIHNNWAGIEALSGIPGSCGAAPIQNIGAYGQELSDVLAAVDFLDYATGHRVRIPASELGLGYRTSELKRGRLGIVIAIELDLVQADGRAPLSEPVAYAQLADALGIQVGERAPLAAVRAAVLRLRASKGMVLDPSDPDSVSAGSFFTNPIVSENFARGLPAALPRWPVGADEAARVFPLGSEPGSSATLGVPYSVKLSAAWLIERAGISRGFAIPGSRAAISSKHTLAIVNRGGATAVDIVQLADFVQTRVMSEFGIRLHPEPVYLGIDG